MAIVRTIRTYERLPDSTYMELVGGLFAARVPPIIMSLLFAGAGAIVQISTRDRIGAALLASGILASIARLHVLFGNRRCLDDRAFALPEAEAIEVRFASTYILFAVVLGAFCACAFRLEGAALHMLLVALLVGYAAGVAAGVALRPWIAVPSILAAVLPTVVVAGLTPALPYRALAVSLAALTVGGIGSVMSRYRSEAGKITMRRTFSELARHDHLTGLPNRLALFERFADLAESVGADQGIAIHCLDLDGFKPVNDRFGHPVGDAVLKAVADRLRGLSRGDDFTARLGGDEFVFVQTCVKQAHESEAMALRIRQSLGEPYAVATDTVMVGATVGYATSFSRKPELEALIQEADAILIDAKMNRVPPNALPVASAGPKLQLVQ